MDMKPCFLTMGEGHKSDMSTGAEENIWK